MASDHDKLYSSSENEGRKRHGMSQSSEEKAAKSLEDLQNSKPSSIRFYQGIANQTSMGHRAMGEHPPRPVPMSVSPRGNLSEDSDLTDAMVFLNRIKEEYAGALPVYDSFLETMRDFKFGKIDAGEVCKAVRILFKDKSFLVRQFDEYLPHHLRFNDSRAFNPHPISDRHKFQQYRMPGYAGNPPMPMGRMMPAQPMHMSRPVHPVHPPVFMGRPSRTSPPMAQPIQMKPPRLPMTTDAETPKHRLANDFIQLVKKKYATKPIIYKQFIELLQNSKNGFDKLLSQVSALLIDSPELVEKFEKNFRPANTSELGYSTENDPLKAIKDVLAEKGVLEDFLKIINFYNQNYINSDDLVFMLDPIIGDKENMKAFKTFIKYDEPSGDFDSKKLKDYEKIGSYKIFPQPIMLNTSSALAKEVLNNMCLSVSILGSEDTYIFRNRNSSEELLSRVGDERSEGDLNMDRLKYLISKLEELFVNIGENQLEMDDIEMSAALIKETFKKVYDHKSNEVLEAILGNPRKAIPVVLSRLHKVYKENLVIHRQRRKFWRNMVVENYYKAYDTKGVLYKSEERNLLALKYIYSEASTPFSIRLEDGGLVDFIRSLFASLASNSSSIVYKRIPADEQISFFNSTVDQLLGEEVVMNVDFDYYALCLYIFTIYTRFAEVKALEFEPQTSNRTAVDVGFQSEFNIIDRYAELERITELLVSKAIDPETYEESVRQLTDSKGYKLYNLKRILSKAEKQVILLIDRNSSEDGGEPSFPGRYVIDKKDGTITLCLIEDAAGSPVEINPCKE